MSSKWTFGLLILLAVTISRTFAQKGSMSCRDYCKMKQEQLDNTKKVSSERKSPVIRYRKCVSHCERVRKRRAADDDDGSNPKPLTPFETGQKCGYIDPNSTISGPYPQKAVTGLRFFCERQKVNNTNTVTALYLQWFLDPKIVKNATEVAGYRVIYQEDVMEKFSDLCVEVGKYMRSIRLTADLGKSGLFRAYVVALPFDYGKFYDYTIVDCREKVEPEKIVSQQIKAKGTPLFTWVTLGAVAAGLCLLAGIGWLTLRRSRRDENNSVRRRGTAGPVTYFSHCFNTEDEIESLLTFAADLTSSYGIVCRIDLLEQRKIDRLTLAVWLNAQLAASDKVIVFINKRYLEAWQQYELCPTMLTDEVEIMKILNEMCYVQQHLMDFSNDSAKIICLLSDDVQRTQLPDFLRRSPVFTWPSPPNETNIVSCIMGMETRELGV